MVMPAGEVTVAAALQTTSPFALNYEKIKGMSILKKVCYYFTISYLLPIRFLKGTDSVVTAKKIFRDHTEIYSTLPLHLSDQFRDLFRAAGCHVYNDSNDFTYEHSGLLLLHTKEGGKRVLHLRNGKEISMEFAPHSTTLLDGRTGKVLLE